MSLSSVYMEVQKDMYGRLRLSPKLTRSDIPLDEIRTSCLGYSHCFFQFLCQPRPDTDALPCTSRALLLAPRPLPRRSSAMTGLFVRNSLRARAVRSHSCVRYMCVRSWTSFSVSSFFLVYASFMSLALPSLAGSLTPCTCPWCSILCLILTFCLCLLRSFAYRHQPKTSLV